MGDLISRSDVIKALEECNLDKSLFEKDVFEKINAIPTACDVDIDTIDAGELLGNGWIPYATDCKMPNEASRVWLSFTTPITSFVKSAWWVNDHFEWNNGRTVKDVPLAWKPDNDPEPYQPKGE